VYSSAHADDGEAERTLRDYVAGSAGVGVAGALMPRKLSFQPGYRRELWHRNCVAVGLAAGFVEPLEASALALVEFSAASISEQLPSTRAHMDFVSARFNDAFRYRWERAVEFLKLHYVLSRRTDTAYWADHRAAASVPPRLSQLLESWRHHSPSRHDFHRIEEIFPSASYHYVLYGMAFRPESLASPGRAGDAALAEQYFSEAAALRKGMLAGLPAHRVLLDQLRTTRLHRV
jgi:tryptophan halogenase